MLKMANFGMVALRAHQLCQNKPVVSPTEAWKLAALEIFPNSVSMQEKGCPKTTFLGLCGLGYVKGIPCGYYTRSVKNMRYGERAVQLLREFPDLANDEKQLWAQVIGDGAKSHNAQMTVVLALWNTNLIS